MSMERLIAKGLFVTFFVNVFLSPLIAVFELLVICLLAFNGVFAAKRGNVCCPGCRQRVMWADGGLSNEGHLQYCKWLRKQRGNFDE